MLKRYLKLLWANYRYSLSYLLEYRVDFFILMLRRVLNLAFLLFFLNIIFLQTSVLAGWGKYQVFMLFGSYLIVLNLIKAFVDEGLAEIPELIRTGKLDIFLTKPVNSRFFLSTRMFSFDHLFDVFFGMAVIIYSLKNLNFSPPFIQIIIFFLTIIFAALIFYFIYFLMITFAIWFVRLDNLRNLFSGIVGMSRVPPTLYKGAVGFFFNFIIPLSFVSIVPTQAILGLLSLKVVFLEIFVFLLFNFISARFWGFALRYYTSASS